MHKLPDADSVQRMVGDFMCGKVFHLSIVLAAKVTLFRELSQPLVVVPIAEKVAFF